MNGICGSASEPAESIVLSGGYEDDEDLGNELIYTGEGGNDPQTKKQVFDQQLIRGNAALVKNLLEGVPIRVVRGASHRHELSPSSGYVYAGLYRVERYWQDRGKSGFLIWRFRLSKVGLKGAFQIREPKEEYGPTKRVAAIVSRIVRTTALANRVKQMHNYTCQVCGVRLETPGGPYAEAAHIRPLGRPHHGPDIITNILCLCANCHLLFDTGAITIDDDLTVTGTQQRLRTVLGHHIRADFLQYHRQCYLRPEEYSSPDTET
ncbi:putative restriction endonuclease [Armatimonas rosea]|uniref:Putative restriction endonuclease n=2 Tax=Armatimonas rosea TaxID=685828 RepID=A0A7W9SQ15_ARMRO|nr:putative restriction endonuclease [Armatimonas rosea]